jgi:hypothetical protein
LAHFDDLCGHKSPPICCRFGECSLRWALSSFYEEQHAGGLHLAVFLSSSSALSWAGEHLHELLPRKAWLTFHRPIRAKHSDYRLPDLGNVPSVVFLVMYCSDVSNHRACESWALWTTGEVPREATDVVADFGPFHAPSRERFNKPWSLLQI